LIVVEWSVLMGRGESDDEIGKFANVLTLGDL
jgi:hypothetical protein